jgi:hypothetical protein
VLELRNDFPNAKIPLLAIFPRGLPGDSVRDKIAEINSIIGRLGDQRHVFNWTSAPRSSMRGATSSRMRSGPTTCTHWPKATTFGARP